MVSTKDYGLPVHKAEDMRRNIEPVKIRTVYSLEDIRKGDMSGTTDTDSKTDKGDGYKGYTDINKKHG